MSQFEAGTMLAIKDFISAYKRDLNRRLALATQIEGLLAAVAQTEQPPPVIWSQWPTASEARQPLTTSRA